MSSKATELEREVGELPTGWSGRRLLDISRPRQWPTISREQFTEVGYPVYGANGQIGYYSQFTHESETIAITCRGATCGTINLVPAKSYITGNAMALDELDTNVVAQSYLYQALQHWGVANSISGSAQPQITRQSLCHVAFPFPPLDEQRRIAEVLQSVDEAIAAASLVIAQADEAFDAVLADLFSCYGHASAKLESYCLAGGLQTGPFGSQLKAEDYVDDGVPVIMPVDLTPNGMAFASAKKAPVTKSHELARHILQPGDVLFARRGEIGRCGLYLDGDPVAMCGTGCLRARLDTTKIDPALAYFLIQSRQARDWLCAHAVGATMPNLNTTIIGDLPMPDIPQAEQGAWVDALLMIEGTRRINQRTLASYQNTKSTLMSDLLSGRVRVPA